MAAQLRADVATLKASALTGGLELFGLGDVGGEAAAVEPADLLLSDPTTDLKVLWTRPMLVISLVHKTLKSVVGYPGCAAEPASRLEQGNPEHPAKTGQTHQPLFAGCSGFPCSSLEAGSAAQARCLNSLTEL